MQEKKERDEQEERKIIKKIKTIVIYDAGTRATSNHNLPKKK